MLAKREFRKTRFAPAVTEHSHLSVVQFVKEPLPLQRERDSDSFRCRRQALPCFLFRSTPPPPTLFPSSPPPHSTAASRRGADYIDLKGGVNTLVIGS